MTRWYVAHTHTGSEVKAVTNLARQDFAAYIPRYSKLRRHARRTEAVHAPLFPGYVFISLDLLRDSWRKVHSTIGIRHLICAGEQPLPVPDGIVEAIRESEGDDGLVVVGALHPLRSGDAVRVLSGAFSDLMGIFQCYDDRARVSVLLTLMGRPLNVRLPLSSIAGCA